MKTNELREKYLDFFVEKGHTLCKSDVLCPKDDPTVLFTPAGMNPFKDHFLGNVELEFTRATSCQKCVRTGDIENVGKTAYHHTFFEMLGNFSFGDYFKRDAIHWAWEFLTDKKWMGINPDLLTVTIYKEDDEASDIWHKDIGLSLDRISREDEDENFWPASAPSKGPNGVCGPCSEIYYNLPDGSDVEIWNLVFTQFNRNGDPPNNLEPLPSKNIDTGMGLERISAVLQNVDTNYHIDILRPMVEAAGEVCGIKYDPNSESGRRLRRIADHVRACTFSIHENVLPGNSNENAVIKQLLRRATLDGYQLGIRDDFLNKVVPAIVEGMSVPYPELSETQTRVMDVIKTEEQAGMRTIERGIGFVQPLLKQYQSEGRTDFCGEQAFFLHQTHGVSPELIETLADDIELGFDWEGYNQAKTKHAEVSNAGEVGVMGDSPLGLIKKEVKSTTTIFYDHTESNSEVKGLLLAPASFSVEEGRVPKVFDVDLFQQVDELNDSNWAAIVIDPSPFYAESGGQVGDTGTISSESGTFDVLDTQKSGDVIVHIGKVSTGTLSARQSTTATVNSTKRHGIQRAHSATHILHYALQQNLGSDATQQGSKVDDDFLRFDFSYMDPVEDDKLLAIEQMANERVSASEPIKAEIVPLDTARTAGAMMLFGEKYPDPCRMVSMGEFSKELCGGIHLTNTSEVGLLEITSESNVAAGVRRVEAVTGKRAEKYRQEIDAIVDRVCKTLDIAPGQMTDGIQTLIKNVKGLRKQVSSGNTKQTELESIVRDANAQSLDYLGKRTALRDAARAINTDIFQVESRVSGMLAEIEDLKKQLETLSSAGGISADDLIAGSKEVRGVKVIASEIPGGNPNLMRQTIDQIRKKSSPCAVFLGTSQGEGKVMLVAGVSKDLVDKGISAGDWIKKVAPVVGGGGGGKPDMAQAGGKQPEKLPDAMLAAISEMQEMIGD